MTTKLPLGAVLMELALQCHRRGLALTANWIPRSQNIPADAITNQDYHDFDEAHRVPVDFRALPFEKLHDLLRLSATFVKEKAQLTALQACGFSGNAGGRRKKPRHSLRVREPW